MRNIFRLLMVAALTAVALNAHALERMGGRPDALEGVDVGAADEAAPQDDSFVRVLLDSDIVHLKDGREIHCTIILMAARAAIVLTEDGEQLIPREDIAEIVQAKDREQPTTLPVRRLDGFRFIVMEPTTKPVAVDTTARTDRDGGRRMNEGRRLGEDDGGARPEPTPEAKRPATTLERLTPKEIQEQLNRDGGFERLLKQAAENPELMKRLEEQLKSAPKPAIKW